MKIKAFTITNYRSITKAYKVPLDPHLTVLVGKNNEGKSNILKALSGAFAIIGLLNHYSSETVGRRILSRFNIKNSHNLFSWNYNWERDFPVTQQHRKRKGNTVFELHFILSDVEQYDFFKTVGYKFNKDLPLRIILDKDKVEFKVPKKSHGGKSFNAKLDKIAKFISSRLDSIYIPAVRPASLTLSVINSLLNRRLQYLVLQDQKYKDAIALIEKIQNKAVHNFEKELQETLSLYVSNIVDVKLDYNTLSYQGRSSVDSIEINDGVATSIFEKGEGLQSLISLAIMQKAKVTKEGITVAIDEPESHLHPEAIRQIRENLLSISKSGQVIIATHSPILINRDKLNANIIVSDNKATPVNKISQIRNVLGVAMSDNLMYAEYVLLVEGSTDAAVLSRVLSKSSESIRQAIQEARLIVKPLFGVRHLCTEKGWLNTVICRGSLSYLDHDQAARDSVQQCKEKNILEDKEVIFCIVKSKRESELEDMFLESKYLDLLPTEGIPWQKYLHNQQKKWSDNIADLFKMAGRNLDILKLKNEIAERIQSMEDLDETKISTLLTLKASLEKLLRSE